jgi:hypothetical protein
MAKSGNPAKAAKEQETLRPSAAGEFKKRKGGIFELPSGLVMKLKNPGGMVALMSAGMMPNSLMSMVQDSLNKGKPMEAEDIVKPETGGVDPTFVSEMNTLLNNLIVLCAVEPKVFPVPENEDDRSDDFLYADEIDEEDKMFVFGWVSGGTTDLEQFRAESKKRVDSLGKVAEARGNA